MVLIIFLGCILMGAGLAWQAVSGLLPVLRAIETHAPMVTLSPRDSIGLPLALCCFAFAAMALYPVPPKARQQGRRRAKETPNNAAIWLGLVVAGLMAAVVATPVTEVVVQVMVSGRGYRACPYVGERYSRKRWIAVDAEATAVRCPTKPGDIS